MPPIWMKWRMPAQEAVAVALRKTLLVSLDGLLAVVGEFLNPYASRSGLDRRLRRHGVGNLRDLKARAARPKHSGFKAYEPGYIHIDVKYLPQIADEKRRRYLVVAIDRATRRDVTHTSVSTILRKYLLRLKSNTIRVYPTLGCEGICNLASV